MRIGINGYEAVVPRLGYEENGLPKRVGSGEYCYQLLVNLNRIDKKNEYLIYLPKEPTSDLPKESSTWHYKIVKKRSKWNLFDLSFAFFKRERLDVFFSPTHYLPLFLPFPSVISILDLSYLKFPSLFKKRDLYQLKIWGRYSISKAKKILTISDSSRNDIIKEYGIPDGKVAVTYPGVKSQIPNHKFQINSKNKMQNSKLIKEKYGIEGDYILFVGTLQPRKNVSALIEAFAQTQKNTKQNTELRGKDRPLQLVIIGRKGWQYEDILESPKKFNIEDRVKFLENVTDEDLPLFYKNALCFVLPSLYEGFGLPVLEAMQNGCPVITSNTSSLPEAGGDAALYVDPKDANDISDKIQKLISNKKLRDDMIEKGYKQVKKFSWEKTAEETLKVLEEAAKK